MDDPSATLADLAARQAQQQPDAIAIEAPDRQPLTYAGLHSHLMQIGAGLLGMGIAPGDRVAIVLPNGPEMATAFLAVAGVAASAPLNPDYRAEELEFYLSDLNAKALIVGSTLDSPARDVCKKRGIPVIELYPRTDAAAGLFTLGNDASPASVVFQGTGPDDVALLLHTSGSTSRPKLVPLTQANLIASAKHISQTLRLTPADRCLNVMPLFHIHGLIAAVTSSLRAGGSVICTPGCLVPKFFGWIDTLRPTWYTAVPTMHQMILGRAETNKEIIARAPLRFVRSSSAALPPKIMAELEKAFACPVVEAYGMTEATHQMACNPLPPLGRKPGSVGLAAGPEIAIMDDGGTLLSQGATAEIVIRGANVTPGYENNPAANAAAFTNGWFRTGDQGYLDEEGYLFITGRLKEIINRGGEKVSPREVDEVLLEHPAIAQVVTFAAPDARLGETVAAAVVLKQGMNLTEEQAIEFAGSRLADFKVPTRVVFLDQIPKGPTGKMQRIGLAAKLGITGAPAPIAAAPVTRALTQTEEDLVAIWQRILTLKQVGIRDNFFELGGDSLLGVQMLLEVEARWHKRLRVSTLCIASTIEQVAAILDGAEPRAAGSCLIPIQPKGKHPPLFCIHGIYGDVVCFRTLSQLLGPDQPLYGVQPPESAPGALPPTTVAEMATRYLQDIRSVQPKGPYYLAGLSFGGLVAFEMARQLVANGESLGLVALLDSNGPNYKAIHRLRGHIQKILHLGTREKLEYFKERASGWSQKSRGVLNRWLPFLAGKPAALDGPRGADVLAINQRATMAYKPGVYAGNVKLFRAEQREEFFESDPLCFWGGLASGGVDVYPVPGTHDDILRQPSVRVLARLLQAHLG